MCQKLPSARFGSAVPFSLKVGGKKLGGGRKNPVTTNRSECLRLKNEKTTKKKCATIIIRQPRVARR